jgi:hypothetical protein
MLARKLCALMTLDDPWPWRNRPICLPCLE